MRPKVVNNSSQIVIGNDTEDSEEEGEGNVENVVPNLPSCSSSGSSNNKNKASKCPEPPKDACVTYSGELPKNLSPIGGPDNRSCKNVSFWERDIGACAVDKV